MMSRIAVRRYLRWVMVCMFALHLNSQVAVAQQPQCIADGGDTVCTDLDVTSWNYGLCDRAGASVGAYAAWCRARGGVYMGLYANPECAGGDPFTNEANIVPLSEGYYRERIGCPATSVEDTGWGQTVAQDYLCWSGGPVYQQGHLVSDLRVLTVSGNVRDSQGQCTVPGGQYQFVARKDRELKCPLGFEPLINASGNWVGCYNHKDDTCPVNNPVFPGRGGQIRKEVDYATGYGPLRLERTYQPQENYLDQGREPARVPYFGAYWYFNYGMRVDEVAGSPAVDAIVIRPDGKRVYFDHAGLPIHRVTGPRPRLMRETGGGWVLAEGARRERYDAAGGLIEVVSADGERVQVTRDTQLRKIYVTDERGRQMVFSYSLSLHIDRVDLPDGKFISFTYEVLGDVLASVQRQDSASMRYSVNRFSPDFSVFDESGNWYSWHRYGGASMAVVQSNLAPALDEGRIGRITYQYAKNNDGSTSTTITDALGGVSTMNFDLVEGSHRLLSQTRACSSCGGGGENFTYDASGNPQSVTDFLGVRADHTYSDDGLLLQKTEAANVTSGHRRVTTTSWDHTLQLPTSRSIHDASGTLVQLSQWTYNARGQTLSETQVDPSTQALRVRTRTYCEQADVTAGTCPIAGLLISDKGAGGAAVDETLYTYYAADAAACSQGSGSCPYRKGDLWKISNALGTATEYRAYDGAGRPLSIVDINGVVTDYEYHARGWVTAIKVRGADDTVESDDRVTRMEYWPTGLVKQMFPANGASVSFSYDAAQRLVTVSDDSGNTLNYTLDRAGNRVAEEVRDSGGTLKATLGRVYNSLGQLVTEADAGANPTDYTYDDNENVTSRTDALGHETTFAYDPLNRLRQSIEDVGGIAASTAHTYNALDAVTEITDPKGLKTTYQYNGFGDLLELKSPDTGVSSYTYDPAGNVATARDARGKVTTYGYDALNRPVSISYANASYNVAFGYDVAQPACAAGERFAKGRRTSMSDGSGSTVYCYNRFGDLTRKVQTSNGVALTLRYAYAAGGQLTSMTYPDGGVVDYVRDGRGRITEVGFTAQGGARQELLTGATYHAFGPVAGWTYGSGRQMTRALDLDYRPSAIHDGNGDGLSVGFGYDGAGNLVELTEAGSTLPQIGFDYDPLGRLTQVKDGPTDAVIDAYGYDKTGNRTSKTTADGTALYTYPGTSHRLASAGGIARTYDAAGNTVTIGGSARQFLYDETGRLGTVRLGGVNARNYRYNGKGERVRSYLGSANTYTVFDESGHWLGDYGANGAPVQQAIWMDDLPVGLSTGAVGGLAYIEPDHLGSPRAVIDPIRDVAVWRWDLKGEAFGSTPPDEDPDGDGTPLTLDMRFPGQLSDAASGLNYNYFRDYDPSTGRYVKSDPIGLGGGINTYAYADGSPTTKTDPLGLSPSGSGSATGNGGSQGQQCESDDCKQTFLDCMAQCIRAYDPLNDESKIGLTTIGGTFPKSWVGLPRGLGGASPMTTVPSATAHALGGGGAGNLGGAARGLGRLASPVWIGYGVYLFGMESYCAASCANNKCAH